MEDTELKPKVVRGFVNRPTLDEFILNYGTFIGKFFWTLVVGLLVILGLYWSKLNYDNWDENPVLTSIATSGFPVSDLTFPSVTICSQGVIHEILISSLLTQLIQFAEKNSPNGPVIKEQPIVISRLYLKYKFSEVKNKNLSKDEMDILLPLFQVIENSWKPFVATILPMNINYTLTLKDLLYIAGIQVASNPDAALRLSIIDEMKKAHPSISELEFMLDPVWQDTINEQANQTILKFRKLLASVQMHKLFESYFTSMWYSTLPCYDIPGITAVEDGETTMLRMCYWKERPIPCAAIFDPFPTDLGVCCTFNMNSANDLFVGSQFTRLVTEIQDKDRQLAFQNATKPDWFHDLNFPEDGSTSGLRVILDAHSDLVSPATVYTDFSGFKVLIDSPSNFPFVRKKGFHVRPGHENLVAISAIEIDADADIKSVPPSKRHCLFEHERETIVLHKHYTQANCFLECSLNYAMEEVRKSSNSTCTPWYLPFVQESHSLCDPWSAGTFETALYDGAGRTRCQHCRPDCRRTVYQSKISTQAFRKCDERNFGISQLCNIEKIGESPKPQIYGLQVLKEFKMINKSGFVPVNIESNIRNFYNNPSRRNTFRTDDDTHDAYVEDIGVLNVFFESPVVLKFKTSQRLGWIDFIANVGGLLGLCVGLSIVTVIEMTLFTLKTLLIFFKFKFITK